MWFILFPSLFLSFFSKLINLWNSKLWTNIWFKGKKFLLSSMFWKFLWYNFIHYSVLRKEGFIEKRAHFFFLPNHMYFVTRFSKKVEIGMIIQKLMTQIYKIQYYPQKNQLLGNECHYSLVTTWRPVPGTIPVSMTTSDTTPTSLTWAPSSIL